MNIRSGTIVVLTALCMGASASAGLGPAAKVDFATKTGRVNKWMHCSSWAIRSYPYGLVNDTEAIKSLNLTAFRTHDAPLVNSGQQVVDTHCIFPLMHLDAKDPKNYIFEPTDHLLKLNLDIGMKCFYRLGSSIEHTGDWGYNTRNPPDHDKYAEVLAGIVRHYTQGWADGPTWDIRYWEIINEPDVDPCWRGTREELVHLYVTCLSRLKAEFPQIKVGGPAFGWLNDGYMREILRACKTAGVRPDFMSWHHYGDKPEVLLAQPAKVQKLCAEEGFADMELIINEWHYLPPSGWNGLQGSSSPDCVIGATTGPVGVKGIDSAAYTVAVVTGFQDTPLTQSYYYGSGFNGSWGYMDQYRRYEKVYYAMKLNGELVTQYADKVKCEKTWSSVYPFAALSADGRKAMAIVADYRGTQQILPVEIAGLGDVKRVSACVLDNERDMLPVNVEFREGLLTLVKGDRRSAVFAVTFEL